MRILKPALFIACLIPLSLLVWRGMTGGLTANPIQFITYRTGDWALRFLLITLAMTPLRRIAGWHAAIGLRRMFGLFAFFYATLHVLTYVALDYFFAFGLMWDNVLKARYITAGVAAFVLMIPLAATSTRAMIRRMGGRRWQALHRVVYASAIAGVVHYLWMLKIDIRLPLMYAFALAALLAFRLWHYYDRRRPALASAIRGPESRPTQGEEGSLFREEKGGGFERQGK
jgi:sulfoxide reductase heme-binding subunit YedZ